MMGKRLPELGHAVPTLNPSICRNPNFHAQHSPMGAFMSFTAGHAGSGGGIGVEIGKPATQNLFVGVKQGGRREKKTLRCLPFLKGFSGPSAAANYDVEKAAAVAAAERAYEAYPADQLKREYGWATDKWTTPDFTFTLFTPFDSIPEPGEHEAMKRALLPAVVGRLEVDNTQGTHTKTAVFAIDFGEAGTRLLGEDEATHRGFAWRRKMGVLATLEGDGDLQMLQRWSVAEGLTDTNPIHALGNTAGLVVEVPAGQKRSLLIAIGVHLDGVVTTGLEGRYYYTRYYTGLEDVLTTALDQAPRLIARSEALDAELAGSGLSADQQFLIAHATRSYYGSTQMLDIGGEPYWVVNEGEYCMMNTLDLTVDQVFWELEHNPWLVKNELDMFTRHYAYHDDVRAPGGNARPGGLSFTHDQGVNNNFSPRGQSSYELARLTGCFSFMTMEELLNWVLTATCYVAKTGDADWLTANRKTLAACAESIKARCNADGIMAFDSTLCQGGAEITTYDSLDESLGQARANTYIAVKTWAAWIGLKLLDTLAGEDVVDAEYPIDAIADAIRRAIGPDGVLPAVLEPNNPGYHSRILPVVEALIYPFYWLESLTHRGVNGSARGLLSRSLQGPFIETLKQHTLALLHDSQRRNLFADGGLRLSSTSNNSWMSKIAIFQYVSRVVLRLHEEDAQVAKLFSAADTAHVNWQIEGVSGFWACSDQFINGEAKGSRYYPRVITTALFLDEKNAMRLSDPKVAQPSGV
jgi:hypothetical protein